MKKTVLILMSFLCTLIADAKKIVTSLPSPETLAAINDSIIKEGHQLYLFEKLNWELTDLFLAHHGREEMGGQMTYRTKNGTIIAFFCDKSMKNSLYELRYETSSPKFIAVDSVRQLTQEEKELVVRKDVLVAKMWKLADSIKGVSPEFGQFNADIIRINDHITRLYLLTGTVKPGIIPFGNDYSFDFTNDNRLVAFRRYHRSLIPTQTKHKGKTVVSTIHSHLKDNPYITATDICNFLLYGRDIAGMKSFYVYSTACECLFAYWDGDKPVIKIEEIPKE